MAASGGQRGNRNATKNRPWAEEIAKFMKQNPDKQRKIIEKLYAKAEEGDLAAIKEIFDRTEGKAPLDVNIDATFDLIGMPVEELMDLFHQIRDTVNAPEAD